MNRPYELSIFNVNINLKVLFRYEFHNTEFND